MDRIIKTEVVIKKDNKLDVTVSDSHGQPDQMALAIGQAVNTTFYSEAMLSTAYAMRARDILKIFTSTPVKAGSDAMVSVDLPKYWFEEAKKLFGLLAEKYKP